MDQEVLVRSDQLIQEARKLTLALDATDISPKGVMWAISPETGNGKLWVIPKNKVDKREFYNLVATKITLEGLTTIDAGMVELVDIDRARRMGLGSVMKVTGLSDVTIGSMMLNGISLPAGIVFRMDL
jgi:hypothetical protein